MASGTSKYIEDDSKYNPRDQLLSTPGKRSPSTRRWARPGALKWLAIIGAIVVIAVVVGSTVGSSKANQSLSDAPLKVEGDPDSSPDVARTSAVSDGTPVLVAPEDTSDDSPAEIDDSSAEGATEDGGSEAEGASEGGDPSDDTTPAGDDSGEVTESSQGDEEGSEQGAVVSEQVLVPAAAPEAVPALGDEAMAPVPSYEGPFEVVEAPLSDADIVVVADAPEVEAMEAALRATAPAPAQDNSGEDSVTVGEVGEDGDSEDGDDYAEDSGNRKLMIFGRR